MGRKACVRPTCRLYRSRNTAQQDSNPANSLNPALQRLLAVLWLGLGSNVVCDKRPQSSRLTLATSRRVVGCHGSSKGLPATMFSLRRPATCLSQICSDGRSLAGRCCVPRCHLQCSAPCNQNHREGQFPRKGFRGDDDNLCFPS